MLIEFLPFKRKRSLSEAFSWPRSCEAGSRPSVTTEAEREPEKGIEEDAEHGR